MEKKTLGWGKANGQRGRTGHPAFFFIMSYDFYDYDHYYSKPNKNTPKKG